MIGILIISHGDLGSSLINCANHIMGEKTEHLMYLDVAVQDKPDFIINRAHKLLKQLDSCDGVLILSDICGATPCNIASRLIKPGKIVCLSGINLPMLVRAITYRREPLEIVVEKALSGGKEGVMHINQNSSNAK